MKPSICHQWLTTLLHVRITHSSVPHQSHLFTCSPFSHRRQGYSRFALSALHRRGVATVFVPTRAPSRPTWSSTVRNIDLEEDPLQVISFFSDAQRFKQSGYLWDPYVYASLIKACNKLSATLLGKSIHCWVLRRGMGNNVNVLNSLIHFYLSSSRLAGYARALFDGIPDRTVVTVNCMISGLMKNGDFTAGLSLFRRVLGCSVGVVVKPNHVTLVIVIGGCIEFGQFGVGKVSHAYCWKVGMVLMIEVSNALVDLYAKSGFMEDADMIFSAMMCKDLISWNTMLAGYARDHNFTKARALFKEMRAQDMLCDKVSLISMLVACANSRNSYTGRAIHTLIKTRGVEVSGALGAALISMYSKSGLIDCCNNVFDELPRHDLASLNSMIHAYVECGRNLEAISLIHVIRSSKLKPDEMTMLGLISACRNFGEICHSIDMESFFNQNDHLHGSIVLQNALIDMFGRCSCMPKAKSVLQNMVKRDIVSWTSIISGHAINGEGKEALAAFQQMVVENVVPNSVTFIAVLSACAHSGLVDEGRRLYDTMRHEYHIEPKIEHCGCMVDMFARAGLLEEAYKFVTNMPVECNAVIWRTLISGCRAYGDFDLGVDLVSRLMDGKTRKDGQDHVASSNIFAEAGRWNDVLKERGSMAARKAQKIPGKSLVPSLT
ncbi:pentatricopeptide repeat-containing protein At1g77170, mitochondrial-like [Rhodamnia argentea]|uniref:Pentatricopeptide repeat-containing protein At1g77170, mitochondrial-like n=1 Tax=Rhodamnia argentea TaxID=178133 RepID=A0A8B8NH41_9MYRT|nr:pentatricopeptide repeat-containing protein At1g77170, mitochondrial-like [Rhodamnia argentea]